MVNYPALGGCLAAVARPGLLLPHVAVRDIRALDWKSLYDQGVRGVVFDKDNCLTTPLSSKLVPEIEESFDECRKTFGNSNVLIVSNSAGSSIDPLAIRAADLSISLKGTPVLWHKHKKPSRFCSSEIVAYFAKQSAFGSIAVVGDRPTTDIILAHRIDDELKRARNGKQVASSADQVESSEGESRRGAVAVYTTGLWVHEGWFNQQMRNTEMRVIRALVKRGVSPGGGWRNRAQPCDHVPSDSLRLDETSRGLVGLHASLWQKVATRRLVDAIPPLSETSNDATFAFSHERQPGAGVAEDPTISSEMMKWVRRRSPLVSRMLVGLGTWKPVVWTRENLQEGLRVLWLGLAQGFIQAGIWQPKKQRDVPDEVMDHLASPQSTRKAHRYAMGPTLFVSRPRLSVGDDGLESRRSDIRQFHFTRKRRRSGPNPTSPAPASSGRVPLRNWIAALAALILAPSCFMLGAWLHELGEEKDAIKQQPEAEEIKITEEQVEARKARELEEARQRVLLAKYHVEREKKELEEKLAEMQRRKAAS